MLRSLQSRLLLSYFAVIGLALLLITLAMLAISANRSARIVPTLRQLAVTTQSVQREFARLSQQDSPIRSIQASLSNVANEQRVRLALLNSSNHTVVFDSRIGARSWTGVQLNDVNRPTGEFSRLDPNLPIGFYRDRDGSGWVVYSQPIGGREDGRFLLLVAKPLPSVLAYFRETFFRPLFRAAIIAVVLALVFAYIIGRSVSRPLLDLTNASKAMARGDYQQQIPLSGPEEIQNVARSFNQMAAEVAATQTAHRDFVANVSHDLKTPITSIQGWSQALVEGAADSDEQRTRAARVIHDEANRMGRMVEQLLDLAKLEAGQLELNVGPIDLSELLSTVRDRYDNVAIEKKVNIEVNAQQTPPVVGDPDRLTQILNNLVDNALANTVAGDRILISTYPFGSSMVEVIIQDTGSGIPEAEMARIFERFYQVEKSRRSTGARQGTGLGLAIVKELVDRHGGDIAIHSQVGQGTTVTIHLPVYSDISAE